jgi:hypothetical protein
VTSDESGTQSLPLESDMNLLEERGTANGLEQLRSWIASGRQPGIGETLKFSPVEVSEGRAVFSATLGAHAYNPIGSVHGGYAATLLDSAPRARSSRSASVWLSPRRGSPTKPAACTRQRLRRCLISSERPRRISMSTHPEASEQCGDALKVAATNLAADYLAQ